MPKTIKKSWKLTLDALLLLLLALMYKKMAISMAFHEIGGLALIGLFVIHHLFNGKWIVAVSKRLFAKETPVKTKLQYILALLLFVDFLLIGISGALISKVVFRFNIHGGAWKTIHYFCAALAIVLGGLHLGLHMQYLFGFVKKSVLMRAVALTLAAVLILFGSYSLTSTSFIRWLSMPFSQSQTRPQQNEQGNESALEEPHGQGQGNGQGNGQGKRDGSGNGQGTGRMEGEGKAGGFDLGAVLTLIASYVSIAFVFAFAAYGTQWIIKRKAEKTCAGENR